MAASVVAAPPVAGQEGEPPGRCAGLADVDVDCGCDVTSGLGCNLTVETPGVEPEPEPAESHRGGSAPTAYWTARPLNLRGRPLGGVGGLVQVVPPCDVGDGRMGQGYVYTLVDAATGDELALEERCVPDGEPADPAAQGFVAPPTLAQVRERTPIPEPVIGRNPAGRGLAGLASWFWVDDAPDTVVVDLSLEGWTVSGSLGADEWRWQVGDAAYTSAGPGSEADPAVEHTFEREGTVEVAVDVAWSGSYTVSGYGTSFTVPGLATTTSSTLDHEVIEVRSVVDAPEADR